MLKVDCPEFSRNPQGKARALSGAEERGGSKGGLAFGAMPFLSQDPGREVVGEVSKLKQQIQGEIVV